MRTGSGTKTRFDQVVLSVGMEISDSVRALGARIGIELDEYGFCHTPKFNPLETSSRRDLRRRPLQRAERYPRIGDRSERSGGCRGDTNQLGAFLPDDRPDLPEGTGDRR